MKPQTKDVVISGRITPETKKKADAQNLNLSELIENAVQEKVADPSKNTLICKIDKYGVICSPSNWIVGRLLESPTNPIEDLRKDFLDSGTQTYYISLSHALQAVSKRILEDKLKVVCKDKPLELKELILFIRLHHEWFIQQVQGI